MNNTIHVEPASDAAGAMRRAFPSYNGRTFVVRVHGEPGMSLVSHWDGGSRDSFILLRLADMALMPIPQNGTPFDNGRNFDSAAVPCDGIAVVEHSIFCGKDMGLSLHVHAANAPKYLPAPPADLSPPEIIVLQYTKCRKASYGGQDRYDMYRADSQYGPPSVASTAITSREHWDVVKAILAGRGFLDGRGAITNAGRNAIAHLRGV